jgi:hypothetical protein
MYQLPGTVAASIVQVLQQDPWYYRHLGPYWWRMKKSLKAMGYGPEAASCLGDEFPDEEALHRFDDMGDEEFLQKALEDQEWSARYRWHQKTQPDPDHEREDYEIHDPDGEC